MKTFPIQHIDRDISARDFAKLEDQLLVTSVFLTIQGEGPWAGCKAVFVRLAGCNYGSKSRACQFCDTGFEFDKASAITYRDLLDQIKALPGFEHGLLLVITGGEPTLQMNLLPFLHLAHPYFRAVQLETNGTQPKFFANAVITRQDHLFTAVVSPKAVNGKYPKIHDAVWAQANCFKFVLNYEPDNPHHTIPAWALTGEKPVYVSPMTMYAKEYSGEVSSIWEDGLIDKEETAKNYAYTAEYAMKHNLIVSVQMHTMLGIA